MRHLKKMGITGLILATLPSLVYFTALADDPTFEAGIQLFETYQNEVITERERIQREIEERLGANEGSQSPMDPKRDRVLTSEESLPALYLHGDERTEYAVVLVHGLNLSAYFLKDLAIALQERGMNVMTLLLSGHGTRPSELLQIHQKQWREDVQRGIEIARHLGDRVILGGQSLGGVLAVDAALPNEAETDEPKSQIDGLLLFAPALNTGRMGIGKSPVAMFKAGAQILRFESERNTALKNGTLVPELWAFDLFEDEVDRKENRPHRYNNHSINAFVNAKELTTNVLKTLKKGEKVPVPTFIVASPADILVNHKPFETTVYTTDPTLQQVFIHPEEAEVSHIGVITRENDMAFDRMLEDLDEFFDDMF